MRSDRQPDWGYELYEPQFETEVTEGSVVWTGGCQIPPKWNPSGNFRPETIMLLIRVGATFARPVKAPEGYQVVASDDPARPAHDWIARKDSHWMALSKIEFCSRERAELDDWIFARPIPKPDHSRQPREWPGYEFVRFADFSDDPVANNDLYVYRSVSLGNFHPSFINGYAVAQGELYRRIETEEA